MSHRRRQEIAAITGQATLAWPRAAAGGGERSGRLGPVAEDRPRVVSPGAGDAGVGILQITGDLELLLYVCLFSCDILGVIN